MALQSPGFNLQFHHDGVPCVDFLLYAFIAGTNTPKDTFQDSLEAANHTHPIVLDEQGRPPGEGVFLEDTGAYDFELRDPDDAPIDSWSDVSGIPPAADETFLPLEGGVAMTGLFELAGPAEAELQPPTLGQTEDLIAAAVAAAVATLTAQLEPIGTIKGWVTATVPTDGKHLQCNGQAISRTTYADLFDLWGVTFGVGDGTTTFNVPDYRGQFLRGYDPTGTVDPDGGSRDFPDVQDFAIENITGQFNGDDRMSASGDTNPFYTPAGTPDSGSEGSGTGEIMAFDASRAVNTSTETRPVNMPIMWIVKALP